MQERLSVLPFSKVLKDVASGQYSKGTPSLPTVRAPEKLRFEILLALSHSPLR